MSVCQNSVFRQPVVQCAALSGSSTLFGLFGVTDIQSNSKTEVIKTQFIILEANFHIISLLPTTILKAVSR